MATLAQRRAAARARLSRSRGGRALLGLGGRTGALVMGGGIGAAAQVAGEFAAEKVDFIGKNWYGEPLALGAGAFLLVRRKPQWAYALAGAAGYSAAFRYKLHSFQTGKSQKSPVPTLTGGASSTTAGMLQSPGTGAFESADQMSAVGF